MAKMKTNEERKAELEALTEQMSIADTESH